MTTPLDGDPITEQLRPFVRIANAAERVFAGEEEFRRWLHEANADLGGRKPVDVIAEGEAEAVIAAMERLRG